MSQTLFADEQGHAVPLDQISMRAAADWIREQRERGERREDWNMLMEIAIVVLVAAELLFDFAAWRERHVAQDVPTAANLRTSAPAKK